jgi:hypothetical protein
MDSIAIRQRINLAFSEELSRLIGRDIDFILVRDGYACIESKDFTDLRRAVMLIELNELATPCGQPEHDAENHRWWQEVFFASKRPDPQMVEMAKHLNDCGGC